MFAGVVSACDLAMCSVFSLGGQTVRYEDSRSNRDDLEASATMIDDEAPRMTAEPANRLLGELLACLPTFWSMTKIQSELRSAV
jgi:hypothetical protein